MISTYRRRKLANMLMLSLLGAAALVAVVPLIAVAAYVVLEGAGAINLDFFTQLPSPAGEAGGGMGNAVVGTLELVAIASALATPTGVMAGIYLAQQGRGTRLGPLVRLLSDVLNGVPTIVVGLFVYGLLVLTTGSFSALAGGVALGVIMLPVIARTTEEAVLQVPSSVREAALALGLPEWRATLRVVLPTARSGILTGVILGVARISGETAPLLFTAFGNSFWSLDPTKPIASLPVQIYNFATGPYESWHRQAWGAALVLMTMVLALNLAARWLSRSR